jgi:hypothetical protein
VTWIEELVAKARAQGLAEHELMIELRQLATMSSKERRG